MESFTDWFYFHEQSFYKYFNLKNTRTSYQLFYKIFIEIIFIMETSYFIATIDSEEASHIHCLTFQRKMNKENERENYQRTVNQDIIL